MRLLIVEDNIELSRLVAGGLAAAGYETDVVSSAGEARDADKSVEAEETYIKVKRVLADLSVDQLLV